MSQRRLSARSFTLLFLVAILLLVVLDAFGFGKPFRSLTSAIINPIQEASASMAAGIQSWFQPKGVTGDLQFQVAQLEEERNSLLVENAELRSLLRDQASANEQSQLLSTKNLRFQVTRVIGRSLDPSAQIIIINRGQSSGVFVGQVVVVEDGIVIGRVSSTTSNTAQVLLVTDRRSKISVEVQNEFNSPGIVIGERGLALRLTTVPQDEPIEFGQSIVTAGLEAGVPRGLLIGTVGDVSSTATNLFQSASIRYPVSLDRLQLVSVVQGPSTDEE
ncbi:MAG: rod shape-determining protein MreC [Candidatus Nomurabacteria bacterium]|nr:MAG: rod shape-determining protein MreC [Candidatus Nomurabacteria bacterium]